MTALLAYLTATLVIGIIVGAIAVMIEIGCVAYHIILLRREKRINDEYRR